MPGIDAKSARYEDNARPNRISRAAAMKLYDRMKDGGYSEREFCTMTGMARRTWRCVTGRPHPSEPPNGRSLLSLRDFIAICDYLHMKPAAVLAELTTADEQSSREGT